MRAIDLKGRRIVIWGLGHEGKALANFIRKDLPDQPLTFVDEAEGPDRIEGIDNAVIVRGVATIPAVLDSADIVLKSPGVSLYHPLIRQLKKKGTPVTSLFNLWSAQPKSALVIGVTGSKGKSTTSALLAHTLNNLGKKTALGGNIGVPVSEIGGNDSDYAVIEVSSYQAADFNGACDIAILTSLFPEHLDWHGAVEIYYADKLNLLRHAKTKIVNFNTADVLKKNAIPADDTLTFNDAGNLHAEGIKIFDGEKYVGDVKNAHLARSHNLSNLCAVLTVIKHLGLDLQMALRAMESYRPLPHRQQELGERDGILYVNDSISTTPQAALAALDVYRGRPVTLIAGGYDRGIDYEPLVGYVLANNIHTVICMGPSGKRIHDGIKKHRMEQLFAADTMKEAIALAKANTPKGGVILLSPAAPSYGLFKDFTARGKSFALESGFKAD